MRTVTAISAALALAFALLSAAPVAAEIVVDITFSAGEEPTDLGFVIGEGGGIDIAAQVDTTAGLWRMVADGDDYGVWSKPEIWEDLTPGATSVYGNAEIEVLTWMTTGTHNGDTPNMLFGTLASDITPKSFGFQAGVRNGEVRISGSGTAGWDLVANVANAIGTGKHTYGWEVDFSGTYASVQLFFDGSPIGSPVTQTENIFGTEGAWFGDGTDSGGSGSAHSENWDRWTMGEGSYVIPEPSTLALLATGLLGLLCYAWRKRK